MWLGVYGADFRAVDPESGVNPARNSATRHRQPRPLALPAVFGPSLSAEHFLGWWTAYVRECRAVHGIRETRTQIPLPAAKSRNKAVNP
jgi:hypothetical protein